MDAIPLRPPPCLFPPLPSTAYSWQDGSDGRTSEQVDERDEGLAVPLVRPG